MMLKKIAVFGFVCGIALAAEAQSAFKTPQEAVRYYEELVGNLTQQVRTLQDENAKLTGVVYQLQRQVKSLEQSTQLFSKNIQDLQRRVEAEANARSRQLGDIANRIDGSNRSASRSSAAPASAEVSGEYDIYEVQEGATLSAISRKTGISVREIKAFNNLSSNNLRVGQKLKIPRK